MAVVFVSAMAFRRHGRQHLEQLRRTGHVVYESPVWRPLTESELLHLAADRPWGRQIAGIVAGNDRITRRVIEALPRLRIIARWGIGCDAIDVAAATEHGVLVANTPGLLGDAVADLAFGLLLALARKIVAADRLVRAGRWEKLPGVAVWGRTLGVVGFGNTGRAMVRRGRGFAMRVLVTDPYADPEQIRQLGAEPVPLEELLQTAEFVSLHAALTPETEHLMNAQTFARMRPGSFLINVARGGLIDEKALLNALEHGPLAGAALDTHAVEPLPPEHPLREREDVILTPHIGFSTQESIAAVNRTVLENLTAALRGERPPHLVNPEAWNLYLSRRKGNDAVPNL